MASSSSGLSAPASEQSSRASTPGPAAAMGEKTPDDSSKLKTFVGILKKSDQPAFTTRIMNIR
jgi:hypothetical protein